MPHGSALSPTLFNIYPEPLASLVESWGLRVISYAYVTQLLQYFLEKDFLTLNSFKLSLKSVDSWMNNNCLKLNSDNTEVLIFGSKHYPDSCNWWPLKMGTPPFPASTARNVWIIFDSGLSFVSQMKTVTGSCFATLKSLRRMLQLVSEDSRKTIFHP